VADPKTSGTASTEERAMERGQCQNREHPGRDPVRRHGAAENQSTHACGLRSGACFIAKSETITTREAMVVN
jgi:hypothetical protein